MNIITTKAGTKLEIREVSPRPLVTLTDPHVTPGPLLKVLGEVNHGRFTVKGSGRKHPFSAEELRAIAKLVHNYQPHTLARTSETEQTR